MAILYDQNNPFSKILRHELPCNKVYENEILLAFHDINPEAKIHIIVIPKLPVQSFIEFISTADDALICSFFKTIAAIAEAVGLLPGGYRLVTNIGANAMQTVEHFHMHLLGGEELGRFVSQDSKPTASKLIEKE